MKSDARERMFKIIRRNIINHGHHITSVMSGESPGFLYTIGLKERVGGELVVAGLATLGLSFAGQLANEISALLREGREPREIRHDTGPTGCFVLKSAHPSWIRRLMLGVRDFYQTEEVIAWQIVAAQEQRPIDTPDMSQPFDAEREPVWRWLDGGWPHELEASSPVVTDLAALRGQPVSQLVRWEADEWEMLAEPGSDLPLDDLRVVSMATLVGYDPSLAAALKIPVGTGLFRNTDKAGSPGPWFPWEPAPEE